MKALARTLKPAYASLGLRQEGRRPDLWLFFLGPSPSAWSPTGCSYLWILKA